MERDNPDTTAQTALLRMITGFWLSHALNVAVRLNIADLVKDGPKSIPELAQATGTHAPALFRVLRALAGEGVFAEDESGRFGPTPASALLTTGGSGSLRAFVREEFDHEHHQAWAELMHSVKTGVTAFRRRFGMDLWQYRAVHPGDEATFNQAMAAFSAAASTSIIAAYDFSSFHMIVDVGGGTGTLLTDILSAGTRATGVVFDLPRVAPGARQRIDASGLSGRCKVVAGDFFESVSPGGDLYILKAVVHDWDDGQAAVILGNCRRAMTDGGRLLLIEAVIPPGNTPFFHKFMDLNMLVMTGGRERTEPQYRALLRSAGFSLSRIVPAGLELSLIEAVPA